MSKANESTLSRTDEILNIAQDFIQTKGYNGFSYRDIAAAIGIKSASIHYHFPTKGDLGRAVTARYSDRFSRALQSLEATAESAHARLSSYAALFRDTLVERERLCLCGMLAGEVETVPETVKVEIGRFFEEQQQWLTKVIQQGIDDQEIAASTDSHMWATTVLSSLEGAMLVARGLDNYHQFDVVTQSLLDALFVGQSHSHPQD